MIDKFINNYYISNILFCVIMSLISFIVIRNVRIKYHITLKDKLIFKQINISLLLSYILITLGITLLIYQLFEYLSKFINIELTSVIEPTSFFMIITSFVATCIFAPITEEIVFRFGILGFLKKKSNTIIALIVSSFIFALLHLYNVDGFVLILILGLICGISYLKTNNLVFPIVIHFIFNLYALFSDYLTLNNTVELCIGMVILIVGIIIYNSSNKNTCIKQV